MPPFPVLAINTAFKVCCQNKASHDLRAWAHAATYPVDGVNFSMGQPRRVSQQVLAGSILASSSERSAFGMALNQWQWTYLLQRQSLSAILVLVLWKRWLATIADARRRRLVVARSRGWRRRSRRPVFAGFGAGSCIQRIEETSSIKALTPAINGQARFSSTQ